ncbi:hypothetical protein BLNAU_7284 [Blattamonas nauphoetae]|uniref:Uncharacterized protein n=1 Tax=Blattamonas nauphoetae TaxID=2049346 RepID=A0ABQ9Y287_9EUKA|nr:hypothetical protein BLNAU_7284 [Blattamonas nauphoetae]
MGCVLHSRRSTATHNRFGDFDSGFVNLFLRDEESSFIAITRGHKFVIPVQSFVDVQSIDAFSGLSQHELILTELNDIDIK